MPLAPRGKDVSDILDKIRRAGASARKQGQPAEANPYRNKPSMRRESGAWMAGWQGERIRTRGTR